ncbi:hypothetical protein, partial [Klebsiella pneumoniae]|uniref:hypothetical protein n=1 Tax=Klebsiella pneumoniae TaxID=573 RepID=UPI0030136E2C
VSKRDKVIFTVVTPYDVARPFTLYEDVWQGHIVAGHPDMANQQANVQLILEEPEVVCAGLRVRWRVRRGSSDICQS